MFRDGPWPDLVMGPGQKFLARVRLGQFFVACVGSGQPFMVWVWIWKISPKNVKFFNFFTLGQKKSRGVEKYPGWRCLIYCGSKVSLGRVGSRPISSLTWPEHTFDPQLIRGRISFDPGTFWPGPKGKKLKIWDFREKFSNAKSKPKMADPTNKNLTLSYQGQQFLTRTHHWIWFCFTFFLKKWTCRRCPFTTSWAWNFSWRQIWATFTLCRKFHQISWRTFVWQ